MSKKKSPKSIRKARKYSVRWFIEFFSAIPRSKWCTRTLVMNADTDEESRCVLGHCGMRDYYPTRMSRALHEVLFPKTVYENHNLFSLNDQYTDPRASVLRALKKRQAKKAA